MVYGENCGHNLNVLAISFGEQRAQGAVNQTCVQNCLIAGASLPTDKAAGNFAHSVHFFFIIHG